jgi:hypothetical protein
VAKEKAQNPTCPVSRVEGGEDQAEEQGGPCGRGEALCTAQGGAWLGHGSAGGPGTRGHVVCVPGVVEVTSVLQELGNCLVLGEKRGGAEETSPVTPALTCL